MNKILDIGEIFDLKLVSLSIPVLISIIVGSIALFLFTNKSKKRNLPESKNTRKVESSGSNDSGKKKKRGTNEGESKTNVGPIKKEKQVKASSSPAKKQVTSNTVPSPTKKNTKKVEEVRSKDVKPKKAAPAVVDTNEGEGWQTVTKKQKKQSDHGKVVPIEQVKASPKKRQDKVSKASDVSKKASSVPDNDAFLQVEADVPKPVTSQDSEWIESQPTKKNKKRALRE